MAPWTCHTHFDWKICQGPLEENMSNLHNAGYQGYCSVEHHSAQNEYAEVAIQIARVRDVLDRWCLGK